ncbi:hypothetical protein IT774_02990 [Salinimonas marina]|uniref:LysR substrate-binding domain-containing protein n=1 Tax=Salinimonas marina TaxID=2785918 RepID=A0A7S9DY80_9ALTE|nr:hypothetical protein [Salinimonas marina]QPG06193.1 hypothetical protein IT774_02990 [Salinimonas marina]
MAEFDDSALLKLFGSQGFGVFCAPSCIAAHVEQHYQGACIGQVSELNEQFFALTRQNQRDIVLPATLLPKPGGYWRQALTNWPAWLARWSCHD